MSTDALAFTTIREDWNDYRLENGTLYRIKVTITNLRRGKQPLERMGEFSTVVNTEPAPEDIGQPTEKQVAQEADALEDVRFEQSSRTTNIYEDSEAEIILVTLMMDRIRKTNLFSSKGSRIFFTDARISISGVVPSVNESSVIPKSPSDITAVT